MEHYKTRFKNFITLKPQVFLSSQMIMDSVDITGIFDFVVQSVADIAGKYIIEGAWNFAGRWSDYALDDINANLDSDNHNDIGMAYIDRCFRKVINSLESQGIKVLAYYYDDGAFDFELDMTDYFKIE